MALLRIPNFRPVYRQGTQISNPGQGGPSGGPSGAPAISLANVPRGHWPNGNMSSNNGSGGGITGFMGWHFAGPSFNVQPGVAAYANQFAYAEQNMFIPGMIKNPGAMS